MARTLRWIALFLLLAGFGHWVWNSDPFRLKDQLSPRRFALVEPGLFRSGQISAGLIEDVIRQNGIDVVIDLQGGGQDSDRDAEAAVLAKLGVRHERFPMPGSGLADVDTYGQAVACLADARRDGHKVLVHCTAGARRTGGVLAVYELLVRCDPARAEAELERETGPGEESVRLRDFINANRAELAAQLALHGVICGAIAPFLVDSE